ncbi:MAG: hypothetical protein WCY25_00140 [Moheibacter sp.]
MKKAFLLFTMLGCFSLFGQSTTIREAYREATKSEEKAKNFYNLVEDVSQSDKAVMVAYKGAGKMLLARYEPLTKRKPIIKEAIEWIESAVDADSKNPEIRLIRLSIQENLPKFLKYHDQIEADRKFVKESLPNLKDKELVEMIKGYLADFSKN